MRGKVASPAVEDGEFVPLTQPCGPWTAVAVAIRHKLADARDELRPLSRKLADVEHIGYVRGLEYALAIIMADNRDCPLNAMNTANMTTARRPFVRGGPGDVPATRDMTLPPSDATAVVCYGACIGD